MEERALLSSALIEIKALRRSNELMKARLSMFDAVMSALHGQPAREDHGYISIDVACQIERYLESPVPTEGINSNQ